MIKFLNCEIDISKKVFVPRIETEFWAKRVIENLKKENKNSKIFVLDIFAGTGCIGISLLKNLPFVKLDFIDISKEAIEQIKINLELNKISQNRYKIFQSNFFEKVKEKKYDLILANPPYVAKERIWEVQDWILKKEPHLALFSEKGGLFHIKKFLNEVKNHLKPKGSFYMEFDPLQKLEIEKILKKQNIKFEFYKDQFKKWRFVKGKI